MPDNGTDAPMVMEFAVTPGVDPAAPALLDSKPVVMPPIARAETLRSVADRRSRFMLYFPLVKFL
jgi:hypothetical protein